MAKYGKGLNKEIVRAVKSGEITNMLNVAGILKFTKIRGWKVPMKYLRVALANASSEQHSLSYGKYYVSLGDGHYKVRKEYL